MATDKYGRLISNSDPKTGTEYGGVDRIIQPPPHDVKDKPAEGLMQMYQTNPAAGAIPYADGSVTAEDQPIPDSKKLR